MTGSGTADRQKRTPGTDSIKPMKRVGSGRGKGGPRAAIQPLKSPPGPRPLAAPQQTTPKLKKKGSGKRMKADNGELEDPPLLLSSAKSNMTAGSFLRTIPQGDDLLEMMAARSDGSSSLGSPAVQVDQQASSFAKRYTQKINRSKRMLGEERGFEGSMRMLAEQVTLETSVADLTQALSSVRRELKEERENMRRMEADATEMEEATQRQQAVMAMHNVARMEGAETTARRTLEWAWDGLWTSLYRTMLNTEPVERPQESFAVLAGMLENNQWMKRCDIEHSEHAQRMALMGEANPQQAERRLAAEHEQASEMAQLRCLLSKAETATIMADKRASQFETALKCAEGEVKALKAQLEGRKEVPAVTSPVSPPLQPRPHGGTPLLEKYGSASRGGYMLARGGHYSPAAYTSPVRDTGVFSPTHAHDVHAGGSPVMERLPGTSPPTESQGAGYVDYQLLYRQHHAKVQGETQARAIHNREARSRAQNAPPTRAVGDHTPDRPQYTTPTRARSQPASASPHASSPARAARTLIPNVKQSPQPLRVHQQYRARSMLARPLTSVC